MDIEQARFNMIEQQIRPWDVFDHAVLDVMQSVPREHFVPQKYKDLAFSDIEIPLANDQIMMSPKVEGRMLQALNIAKGDQVLEVGTGSGYISACLAKLAHHVTTLDIHEELSNTAQNNISKLELNNIEIVTGDIFSQIESLGTFDVVAVTGSIPEYTNVLNHLLRPNGRLFVIFGEEPVMTAHLITCAQASQCRTETLFETCIPSLLNTIKETVFEF